MTESLENKVKIEMKKIEKAHIVFSTDEHKPFTSQRMTRILTDYCKNNKKEITHLVFGGDGVDNPAMSVFPQRPDSTTLLQEEIDMYVTHIYELHKICPKAKIVLLAGNHDVGRLDRVKYVNRSMASLRSLDFENLVQESITNQKMDLKIDFRESYRLGDNYFVHGDPRLDPYIKGGATGIRRTAEMHPEQGNIIMGHRHMVATYPRIKGDFSVYSVGTMADISELAKQYKSYHGYQNGFAIITIEKGVSQVDNIEVKDRPLFIDGGYYD